jgi:hypothetical protein
VNVSCQISHHCYPYDYSCMDFVVDVIAFVGVASVGVAFVEVTFVGGVELVEVVACSSVFLVHS